MSNQLPITIKRLTPPPQPQPSGYEALYEWAQYGLFAILLWVAVYLLLAVIFLRRLPKEDNAIWLACGQPTLLKNNVALYRLLFGQRSRELTPSLKTLARYLRYLTYLGIALIIAVAVLFGILFIGG